MNALDKTFDEAFGTTQGGSVSESPIDLETRFRLLRALERDPHASQRALSREMGLSLGKTNYCLRALVDQGWVKVGNFRRSSNKRRYLYKLTPTGLAEKGRIAHRFLRRKIAEHQSLSLEIERLRQEISQTDGDQPHPDASLNITPVLDTIDKK